MRLSILLTFLTIFGLAVLIFDATGSIDTDSGLFEDTTNIPDADSTNSSTSPYLLDYFRNPTNLFGGSLWLFWAAFLGTLGLTTILSGVFRFTTSDAVTFAAWPIVILVYANFWLARIFTFLTRELSSYMCNVSGTDWCLLGMVFALAFLSIPAIQLILSIQQMWRTGFVNS